MKQETSDFLKNLITVTKNNRLIWIPESCGKYNARMGRFDIWLYTANKDNIFITVHDKKRKTKYFDAERPSGEDIMLNHLWDKLIKTVEEQTVDYNDRMFDKLNSQLVELMQEPIS